ncbi:MAG: CRISPR-associated endonuclease Cas1, partial [Gammaproteobacteria bacterium]
MIKRIIDISERSYVRVKNAQLLVERDKEIIGTAPVEDLGVVILQHPAIVISQSAIIACQRNNVAIVFCDERHLPYSVILPLGEGHTLHQKVLRAQVNAKKPVAKRIWKQIVQQKIIEQK